ncbi:unnamed protein product, partial [Brassica oleracea]
GTEKGSLEPIPLDLKKMDTVTTRSPAKRVVTHHQKEVYESRDNDDGSDKSPGKLLHVLPYDMEVETLTRLPGKSLMKFLCVCKTCAGGDDPKRLFI